MLMPHSGNKTRILETHVSELLGREHDHDLVAWDEDTFHGRGLWDSPVRQEPDVTGLEVKPDGGGHVDDTSERYHFTAL